MRDRGALSTIFSELRGELRHRERRSRAIRETERGEETIMRRSAVNSRKCRRPRRLRENLRRACGSMPSRREPAKLSATTDARREEGWACFTINPQDSPALAQPGAISLRRFLQDFRRKAETRDAAPKVMVSEAVSITSWTSTPRGELPHGSS